MQTDYQSTIDSIEAITERPQVKRATVRLLDVLYCERLSTAIKKMRRKVAYVAVIGPQGCGKSTLLNSLLFNTRVLPEGEGVTTSIVCYIHPIRDGGERCEVHFLSGEHVSLPFARASLEQYMDEAQNPRNNKDVASIHCFTTSQLMGDATSFVDTPGLGSLLQWHDQATMAFVRDMSLGLFVIRATPPMTKSESEYLHNIWKFTPEFVFLQNIWGESTTAVAESLQQNEKIISEVARRNGDNRPITIRAFNIHAAAEEATNPQVNVNESQLEKMRDLIQLKINRGGQAFEIRTQIQQIILCLARAIEAGKGESDVNSMKGQDEIQQLREQLQQAHADIKAAECRLASSDISFRENCREMVGSFHRELRAGLGMILREYSARITADGGRAGVEDEYLSAIQRFALQTSEAFEYHLSEIIRGFVRLSEQEIHIIETSTNVAKTALRSVEDVSGTRVGEFAGRLVEGTGALAGTALAVVGATTFATSIAAGYTATAAVATAASAVPIVGWAIAGTVLAAGLILKKRSKDKRRTILLSEFTRIHDETLRDLSNTLAQTARLNCESTSANVQEVVRATVAQKKKEARKFEATLMSSEEDKRKDDDEIQQMIVDLTLAIADLREISI